MARRQSIDLLDGLDFDFLNGIKTEDDLGNIFDDDMMFDFGSQSQDHHAHDIKREPGVERQHHGRRTSSIDSTTSAFRMFDNMPVYRGHSFGDDSHFVGDMDNLYKEIESGGGGGHHSIFNNGGPAQDVELSAYAAHAVALQGGGGGAAGGGAKSNNAVKPSKVRPLFILMDNMLNWSF